VTSTVLQKRLGATMGDVGPTTLGEELRAFVPHPHPLPPAKPAPAMASRAAAARRANLALAWRLGVARLARSVDWLLDSSVCKVALLTLQIEGTQATLAELFCDETGMAMANGDVVDVDDQQPAWRSSGARQPARPEGPADLGAPAVRRPARATDRRSRRGQAAGRAATLTELDRRRAAARGKARVRSSVTGSRAGLAGGSGTLHPRGWTGLAAAATTRANHAGAHAGRNHPSAFPMATAASAAG
jgi:hypothetical protein